jgi:hydrogenase expression/formation protein HypD
VKYLDEFRDGRLVRRALEALREEVSRPCVLMEVCGGQTHSFVRSGLDRLLPEEIELVHGPGCPVCVTPIEVLDQAIGIAARPDVVFTSFGDMLRVPGSREDLFTVRAQGGDVRVVYSPLDAVRLAQENPDKQVVFFAIGFETTAPANATSVVQAERLGLENYSVLVSHSCVPGAMSAILQDPDNRVEAFLAAGHVCTVMGTREYRPIAERHRVPIVVTGFEPLDLVRGVHAAVRQLQEGRAEVENVYERAVRDEGNRDAQALVAEVFELGDRGWRGIGVLPDSGLHLREAYSAFDARRRFAVDVGPVQESELCRAGEVLRGRIKPHQCEAFGRECTPDHPLGATMVSAEGACAAYHQYGRDGAASEGAP